MYIVYDWIYSDYCSSTLNGLSMPPNSLFKSSGFKPLQCKRNMGLPNTISSLNCRAMAILGSKYSSKGITSCRFPPDI